MELKDHIRYWIASAEHDLEAAQSLLASGRYDWCLFIGHLVLEKAIKALYVRDNWNQPAPRSHDLVRLAERTNLALTMEQKLFLDEVNDFNLEVRYPDYRSDFQKRCTREFTERYFHSIKETFEWLKSRIESPTL